MNIETNTPIPLDNKSTQKLPPWHKPEMQQLIISIDTNIKTIPGSGGDGFGDEGPNELVL